MKHLFLIFILSFFAFANNLDRELSAMKGWTIVGNVSIMKSIKSNDKESSMFEGCDGDTILYFSNNLRATCTSYILALEIMPNAIIFSKDGVFDGRNVTMYKMLVKDNIYDIYPR